MKFEYPIKEITDENASSNLGSSNSFGFYPISRFNSWHGGYHVEGIGLEIRAIADGRVIGYRMSKEYEEEKTGEEKSYYSNCFVLIQHEYKSPKGQELTFFSLYMHLLPKKYVTETKRYVPAVFTNRTGISKGLNVRNASDGKVRFVIPKNEIVTLDGNGIVDLSGWAKKPKADSNYKKVKFTDKNGMLWTNICIATAEKYVSKEGDTSFKVKTQEDEGSVAEAYTYNTKGGREDEIISCDIPVKAGQLVGYSGQYGFERQPNYVAAHIEVFTAEDPLPFLQDKMQDGADEKEKNYLKVSPGAILKKACPGKIAAGIEIKILEEADGYSQVEMQSMSATVLFKDIESLGKVNDVTNFKILSGAHFTAVNAEFKGLLKPDSILLFEQTLGDKRKVKHIFPDNTKKYWVASGSLPGTGDTRELVNDLTEIYEEKPDPNKLQHSVKNETILPVRSLKKLEYPAGTWWYKIATEQHKGWIKATDVKLTRISAYNWGAFGFKVLKDEASEYLYDTKNPPKFLNDLWSQLDTDHNKVLSSSELRNAYNNPVLAGKLSHLVCYHRSEWAWGDEWSTFKAEVKELYREGIEKEEDAALKKKYETKRDLSLDALEARLKALCFWKDIKPVAQKEEKDEGYLPDSINAILPNWANEGGKKFADWIFSPPAYHPAANVAQPASPSKPPAPKVFPTDPKVYHFHPVAFVEQMRRVQSKCLCQGNLNADHLELFYGKKIFFTHRDMRGYNKVYKSSSSFFVEYLNKVILKYEINTCLKVAHFLAQIEHETDHFNTTAEYYDGEDYEGRDDLGNTISGDGPRFKGRGLIQLTGRRNYNLYTNYQRTNFRNHIDFTLEPNNILIASELEYCVDAAGWYWKFGSVRGDINLLANQDDVFLVSRAINLPGATKPSQIRGFNERQELTQRIKELLNYDQCEYL